MLYLFEYSFRWNRTIANWEQQLICLSSWTSRWWELSKETLENIANTKRKSTPTAPYLKLIIFQAAVGNLLQQHVKPCGKASVLLKSKLSGHQGMRQLMRNMPWITVFVDFINSSFQPVQSTISCNHTAPSNQQNGFLSRLKPMPQMVGVKVLTNLLNMKRNLELPISHCMQKHETSSTIFPREKIEVET